MACPPIRRLYIVHVNFVLSSYVCRIPLLATHLVISPSKTFKNQTIHPQNDHGCVCRLHHGLAGQVYYQPKLQRWRPIIKSDWPISKLLDGCWRWSEETSFSRRFQWGNLSRRGCRSEWNWGRTLCLRSSKYWFYTITPSFFFLHPSVFPNDGQQNKSSLVFFFSPWSFLFLFLFFNYIHKYKLTPPPSSSSSTSSSSSSSASSSSTIKIFRPEYGFHTHAYVLTKKAAATLLQNLPVCGPLDVWLADNQWFGLNVYCCCKVVDHHRYNYGKKYNHHGTTNLISQRRHDTNSDIVQSGRGSNNGK